MEPLLSEGGVAVRVLVAESKPQRRLRIHQLLEGDGRFEIVADSTDGDTVIRNAVAVDVVVLDRDIHGRGWLGTVSALVEMDRHPAIVVLTHTEDRSLHEAARREGVDDVVVWPRDASVLPERLAALDRQLRSPTRRSRSMAPPASSPAASASTRTGNAGL